MTFIFKGDEQFAAWPDVNFTPGSCVLIVKEDKNVSDKMDKTVCEQIVGTVEQDWKDDFDVFYAGMEIDSCKVKGNNGSLRRRVDGSFWWWLICCCGTGLGIYGRNCR